MEGLKREGLKLLAKFKQVPDEIVSAIKEGRWKKRSVSFYPDGRLRHVGLLGAMPPAVKGLSDISFKDEEEEIIYYFENNGGDEMDEKDKEIQELKTKISEFIEQIKTKDVEFSEKEKQQSEEIADLKAQLLKVETEKRQAEYNSFCEKLGDKLLPVDKDLVIGFMDICRNTGSYEFSEGKKENTLEKFKDFLERNLKKQVEFGEIATKEKASNKPSKRVSEFEKKGFIVNEEQSELHEKALNYSEKHNVSYEVAVQKVRGENK